MSVILSCSQTPIRFDLGGLVRLSTSLGQIEGRLTSLIDYAVKNWQQHSPHQYHHQQQQLAVPEPDSWSVTMWHIGRYSLQLYAGKSFEITWQDFQGDLIRAYSKRILQQKPQDLQSTGRSKSMQFHRRPSTATIIRMERQEYPKIPLSDAIEQKLSLVM